MRTGQALPESIKNAPDLWLGLDIFYKGWLDLDSTRSVGFSVGPIPWTAIESYSDMLGLGAEQKADMHYHIRQLDRLYLDHNRKK